VKYYEGNALDEDDIVNEYMGHMETISKYIKDVNVIMRQAVRDKSKILFEGHKFHKYTEGKFTGIEEYKDISYPRWTRKWYATGANSEIRQQKEYLRFERAANLDEEAAIKSTSWGRYQIMGFNYKLVGFDDIFTFYYAMGDNELEHLISFVEYIFSTNLQKSLINQDWETFARGFNGSGQVGIYAPKMERAFKKYSNV